jgi:hypothetical protein
MRQFGITGLVKHDDIIFAPAAAPLRSRLNNNLASRDRQKV